MEVISEQKNKQPLPNANATLVLGILSIVFGCAIAGFVLGIIGLAISKDGKRLYDADPEKYYGYGNLQAGRVLSIIGVVIGSFSVLYVIFWVIIGGAALGFLSGLSI